MELWAVIPSWNRQEKVAICIESVLENLPVSGIVTIWNQKPTAHARNLAIQRVPDNVIVLSLDDECRYYPEFKENFKILLDKVKEEMTGIIQITRIMPGRRGKVTKGAFVSSPLCWTGGGLLFRKSVWQEVGGYPPDYLDDIMFSANVYAAGYTNYRTTHVYALNIADVKDGGVNEVLNRFGADSYYPCEPEKYGVTGEPCHSKGIISNIKNPKPTKELRCEHKRAKEQRLCKGGKCFCGI